VLTGRPPAALVAELETPAPLPALPAQIPAGAPGDLLRRRPDIFAAERRLAGATARIGVATADLFPRFTLGGLIGTQAADSDALFERDSETRSIALGIDWSFLDIGRVRARIAATDADAAENLATYEQTVLRALEETENALVRYARLQREREHLQAAAAAGSEAARLARLRFDGGIADFLQVLDAERSQLETEDRLVQSETRSAVALVGLYRAMAGGWPL
jgi:multidrug efflux system outer membrane protein